MDGIESVLPSPVSLQDSRLQLSDLKDPGIYKPLLVGVLMMLFQQLTGINAIMFYAETIFEDAHFKVRHRDRKAAHPLIPTVFLFKVSPMLIWTNFIQKP